MLDEYIVVEKIEGSRAGDLEIGTILDYDGENLYLKSGRITMALNSINGRKTKRFEGEKIEAEEF